MDSILDITIKGIDGKLYVIDNGNIVEFIPITKEKYESLTEAEKMNDKFYYVMDKGENDNG